MHLYCRDAECLEKILKENFLGGQLKMETKEGLIFRGEINSFFVPKDRKKRVMVSFSWLAERRLVLDRWWTIIPKWFLLKPLIESPLDIGFSSYYFQPDEQRLKVFEEMGGVVHIFQKEDHTNLVRRGDEFIPFCQLHQLEFWQAIMKILSPKRQ